jgi:hypothetical protein
VWSILPLWGSLYICRWTQVRIAQLVSNRLWAGQPGFNFWWGKRFFSALQCSDQLWYPPRLLSSRYGVLFPLGQSGPCMKLTGHLRLMLRSRMVELYLNSPTLHRVVLDLLSTGTTKKNYVQTTVLRYIVVCSYLRICVVRHVVFLHIPCLQSNSQQYIMTDFLSKVSCCKKKTGKVFPVFN